ncbi:(2Fe-2S)-binding protein [Azospirillum picis]|uniref:Molibdopterin-dependent oxidoreductase YjgC n=1 Tax=Azospirillum picis TaxID=488438 RepID=A0ABU0MM43_9PROT|nr:(2Fe-2S)-binding protein [Azospirillum picis]MBP2300561.1 putative molibdopterin-dependent oxidoreductase YjgC [Azospirillum picis]MDQ0534530.1 putative molibdopterin-dependent oxidoreductase YjgC [Azospirillum picis]
MFRRLHEPAEPVRFTFDGRPLTAAAGDTVAAALLAAGVREVRRSVVGGEPRAPYCLMGVCFDCLVTIDGVQNRQSCLTEVREGMEVRSQQGRRRLEGAE